MSRGAAEGTGPDLVSVIIPFYTPNDRFLREAIESVCRQTYTTWELVLVNDGCEPGPGLAAACAYAAAMPDRVRVVTYDEPSHRGLSAARNEGVRRALGKYVAFLDADDVFLPHKLELEVNALQQCPPARMVCTNTQYWHQWQGSGTAASDFVPLFGASGTFLPPGPLPEWLTGQRAVPATCGFLVYRDVLLALGFEEAFTGLYEDQVFLAKSCMRYPIVLVNQVTAYYRQHPVSMCATATKAEALLARRRFLCWVAHEAGALRMQSPALDRAIQREIWSLNYPRTARALRMIGRRLAPRRPAYAR